jgi:bifunctional non-homologous end joining protein LigD
LVVEVAFAYWTHSVSVRHATFRGVRTDKPEAVREGAVAPPVAKGALLTRRDVVHLAPWPRTAIHIVDKASKATKVALVAYHESVSDLMPPHLSDRPTSLVRAPANLGGNLFFQKHAESEKLAGVKRYPTGTHPGHPPQLSIASHAGLLATAQWTTARKCAFGADAWLKLLALTV